MTKNYFVTLALAVSFLVAANAQGAMITIGGGFPDNLVEKELLGTYAITAQPGTNAAATSTSSGEMIGGTWTNSVSFGNALVAVGVGIIQLPTHTTTGGLQFEKYSMQLLGDKDVVAFLVENAWFYGGEFAYLNSFISAMTGDSGTEKLEISGPAPGASDLDTFFFGILDEPLWLVLDLGKELTPGGSTVLQYLQNGGTLRVEVRGAAAEVPEPATLAVLGLGLAGLGLARRRMKK